MKTMSYLFAIIVMIIALIGAVEAIYSGKFIGLIMCGVLSVIGWCFIHDVRREEDE